MQPKPRNTRILHQFLQFVLPFSILSIAVTSGVLMWTTTNYFHKTIDQDYRNIIRTSASEIDLYMQNAVTDMESLAWILRTARLDDWRTEMVLSAFQYAKSKFDHLVLVTADGRRIPEPGVKGLKRNEVLEPVMTKAFSGETAVSGVRIGPDNLPLVYVTAPVTHLGKINGVLCGTLNLKSVWDVLEGIEIGETGNVAVLDPAGRYLAHREIDHVLRSTLQYDAARIETIMNSPTPVKWIERGAVRKQFCMGFYLPEQEWIIVMSQGIPEIYAYLYANFAWAIAITAVTCTVAVLLGWIRVRRLTRPIESMHRQVRRIGEGDLDHQVAVTSTNEIGELGAAFNEMVGSLRKMLDRQVRSARELAHAKNLATLGVTASKVTHEVGNLINNVGMSANALQRESLSDNGWNALAKMEKESARVQKFIQDFLKFAKPPELQPAPVALDLIIKEVMAMHEPAAKAKGVAVSLDWPTEIPKINVDSRLLYQMFTNLIKNGIEAMENEGNLRVTASMEEEDLQIQIQDSGEGIAPENLERIFEPFFTTKGKKGTGLGMAIVQSIITAHRGTIDCHSEVGEGTRFVIRLPLT